jgi:hypothetical protein
MLSLMSIVGLVGVSIYFYQRLDKLDKVISNICKDITVLAETLKNVQHNNTDYIVDQISRIRGLLIDHKNEIDKLKIQINRFNEVMTSPPIEQSDDVIKRIVDEVDGKNLELS